MTVIENIRLALTLAEIRGEQMFSGIVLTTLEIKEIIKKQNFASFVYEFPREHAEGLKLGASVAQNGVCLTVRTLNEQQDGSYRVSFDAIEQTLKLTNLSDLNVGDSVNIERAARVGDEIGGHLVSGHVFGCINVLAVEQDDWNMRVVFDRPTELRPYLLNKGFVALNGCSLTIAEVTQDTFTVCLIPETRDVTVFGQTKVGDQVNLEIDPSTQATVDTIKELMVSGQLTELINSVKNE
jgi:riboflavin synthase